jgi:hypothetical protein
VLQNDAHLSYENNLQIITGANGVSSISRDASEAINVAQLSLRSLSFLVILILPIEQSGKSTYLRMVGVVTVLAHIGCFVPAEFASIRISDQIITRQSPESAASPKSKRFKLWQARVDIFHVQLLHVQACARPRTAIATTFRHLSRNARSSPMRSVMQTNARWCW